MSQEVLTEEQDGAQHLEAARALLNQSLMVTVTEEGQIVPISEEDFEVAHADIPFGRLRCWILFSVGAEYLIKGVLMTKFGGYRRPKKKAGKYEYFDLDYALNQIKVKGLTFGSKSNGKPISRTLADIRNRDLHHFAKNKRQLDYSKVPDLAQALSTLLQTVKSE